MNQLRGVSLHQPRLMNQQDRNVSLGKRPKVSSTINNHPNTTHTKQQPLREKNDSNDNRTGNKKSKSHIKPRTNHVGNKTTNKPRRETKHRKIIPGTS